MGPVVSYEWKTEFNRTVLLAEQLNQSVSTTHTNPCQSLGPERWLSGYGHWLSEDLGFVPKTNMMAHDHL